MELAKILFSIVNDGRPIEIESDEGISVEYDGQTVRLKAGDDVREISFDTSPALQKKPYG